jgi:hypothetical protein
MTGNHVGQINKQIALELQCTMVGEYKSDNGAGFARIIRFITPAGDVIKWKWTHRHYREMELPKLGHKYHVAAYIRRHTELWGTAETVIERVRILGEIHGTEQMGGGGGFAAPAGQ